MSNIDSNTSKSEPTGKSREWNYHPNLPIGLSPVFDIPPKSKAAMVWLIGTWFKIAPPLNHLLFALVTYIFLWPSKEAMQTFNWSWTLQIFAIYFGAVLLLAGSLHTYFYALAGQKMRLKFDVRMTCAPKVPSF